MSIKKPKDLGIRNSELLEAYCRCDPRVPVWLGGFSGPEIMESLGTNAVKNKGLWVSPNGLILFDEGLVWTEVGKTCDAWSQEVVSCRVSLAPVFLVHPGAPADPFFQLDLDSD